MSHAPALVGRAEERTSKTKAPSDPLALDSSAPSGETAVARDEDDVALAKARVGTKVAGWRLARLLGVGPVSAAYEAYRGDDDAGEHAVLRLLSSSLSRDERARVAFVRAAYAATRFRHPRVLSITGDGSTEDGAPFVLRPWHDLRPLSEVLDAREMTERETLRMAEQLLDALEMAHAHGIVHGAITMGNVLLTPRGSVRLCDFAVRPGPIPGDVEQGGGGIAARRSGPHAAPEQSASPAPVPSEQADIWSVAACMYFAFTKQWPRGDRAPDTAPARPLRSIAPHASEPFAAIVDFALRSDAAERYDSAYAMLGDVRRAIAGRAPKLAGAKRPVPSGSYRGLSPSMVSALSGRYTAVEAMRPSLTTARRRRRSQWRGNVALVLAILILVGIATFVMVREKMADERSVPARTAP